MTDKLTEDQIKGLRAKAEITIGRSHDYFHTAPATVLALLDENEELRSERDDARRDFMNKFGPKGLSMVKTQDMDALRARAEALEKERDEAARVIGDFMLVPPDGGDLTLAGGAQQMRDALTQAEAARDEARDRCTALRKVLEQTADKIDRQTKCLVSYSLSETPRKLPAVPTLMEIQASHLHDITAEARTALEAKSHD